MEEPISANVQLMASLSGLSPSEAARWLKRHNDDVNTAINAYWDEPKLVPDEPSRDSWNESQFHSDKSGNAQPSQLQHSFAVHPQDTLNPNVFAAPSRPPSRVSTRAGGPIVDTVDSNRQTSVAEQENEHLQQAMAISMNQAIPGQESGVTNVTSPYFGPATRAHYENSNWTLTIPRSNTKEILLNPEPMDRRREAHTPAFLKPSTEGNRLSALIKILQTIPLSREALLNRGHVVDDYGYDNDWWDGTAIKTPYTANLIHEGLDSREDEMILETQRLIAFLEGTERAYGSVDNISNLQGIEDLGVEQMLARYLIKWRDASALVSPDYPLLDIFKSTGLKTQTCEPRLIETHDFHLLELRIDDALADRGQTLYEAIDDILWSDESENAYENVYLSTVGDLFIIEATRVSTAGSGLGIKIPLVWYSDRYLESSIAQVKEMQANKLALKKELERFDQAKADMLRIQKMPELGARDSVSFLQATIKFLERSALRGQTNSVGSNKQDGITGSPELEKYSVIAEQLKSVTARIAEKLKSIEDSKQIVQKKLDKISKLYTKSADNPKDPPHHKYTLRGVCTNTNTVYVLERTQLDIQIDNLSSEAKDWQWWKLKYVGGDSKPISRIKVREIEVLKAAKDESRSALLVYASEKAISYEIGELPMQLRTFVRLDNLSFAAELERAASPKPMSPSKRKANDQEDDNLTSRLYHSPQQEEHADLPQSSDALDPTLPAYASTNPSPPLSPSRPSRTTTRNLRNPGSYDNLIPSSLRATGPNIDASSMSSMMLDQEDPHDMGQEMQDRGGRIGILQKRNGAINSGYTLGSYEPEILIEDQDEEELPQSMHIEYANP